MGDRDSKGRKDGTSSSPSDAATTPATVAAIAKSLRGLNDRYVEELCGRREPQVSPHRLLFRYYEVAGELLATAIDLGAMREHPSAIAWRHAGVNALGNKRPDHLFLEVAEKILAAKWPGRFLAPVYQYNPDDFRTACDLLADVVLGKVPADESDAERWVTVTEAALSIDIGTGTISNLCKRGQIRFRGDGPSRRIDIASLAAYKRKRSESFE